MGTLSIYVLCGIPGCGKTRLAHRIAEQHNAAVHTIDDIPGAWDCADKDGAFRNQWIASIKTDLRNGISVVCDSTALTSETRKWILRELSDFDCKKNLIVKVVPLETCLQRNKGRVRAVSEEQIRLQVRLLEPPSKDEGWDAIYVDR